VKVEIHTANWGNSRSQKDRKNFSFRTAMRGRRGGGKNDFGVRNIEVSRFLHVFAEREVKKAPEKNGAGTKGKEKGRTYRTREILKTETKETLKGEKKK